MPSSPPTESGAAALPAAAPSSVASQAIGGTRDWLIVAALLALMAALGTGLPPAAIDWQPARVDAEPWRAWTAVGVHYSGLHLAANAGGLAAVAVLGWAARLPRRTAWMWWLAWPLTQLALLLKPDLVHAGGLSGVLHAGVAAVGVHLVAARSGRARHIGIALLLVLTLKVASEAPWGTPLRHPAGWDIAVAPFFHAAGLVVGTALACVAEAWQRATARPMPPVLHRPPLPTPAIASAVASGADATAPRRERLDGVAVASLLACVLLWALNQIAVKVALPEVPALAQAAWRSLGGAALLLLWMRWRGLALATPDGTLRAGVLTGLLFAGEFACIFSGLQYTSASRMVIFLYSAPFVVALGMPFIARGERLAPVQWGGLVLAFAGVVGALAEGWHQPSAGPLQWLGDLLGVGAALLWGATTLSIRGSRLAGVAAEKTLLYQLGISGLVLAAAAAFAGAPAAGAVTGLSPLVLASLAFQTVVVAFASYLLWFWLVRHYPATRLASFTLLTPIFGLLFGALLLDEAVTARLLIALATVLMGLVLVNGHSRRAAHG